MKHIEQILPEYAAEELERIVREEGDATASAALTALLHNVTGCAIPPTATIPESEVEELVPLCLSILRRHWQTPLTALGDGTTPMSLADLMRRLIGDRVQGNEAWSIPPIHANIPTAVAALLDRKIDCANAIDGISLESALCSGNLDYVTTLIDSNHGWEWNKSNMLYTMISTLFPNLSYAEFGCKSINSSLINNSNDKRTLILRFRDCIELPDPKTVGYIYVDNASVGMENTEVHMDALEYVNHARQQDKGAFYVGKIFLPKLKGGTYRLAGHASYANNTTKYLYIGCKGTKNESIVIWCNYAINNVCNDVEFGEDACQNITLYNMNGLTPENMYNHILCRLKQDEPMCGEGVTITLGTTNLDKLEAVEEYNLKLTELTDTYGYTFA